MADEIRWPNLRCWYVLFMAMLNDVARTMLLGCGLHYGPTWLTRWP